MEVRESRSGHDLLLSCGSQESNWSGQACQEPLPAEPSYWPFSSMSLFRVSFHSKKKGRQNYGSVMGKGQASPTPSDGDSVEGPSHSRPGFYL